MLYLAGMYPTPNTPQHGIFCHEQVRSLVKAGCDVEVIVPLPFYSCGNTPRHWELDGITIQYVRYFKVPGTFMFEYCGLMLYYALKQMIDFKKFDLIHSDTALPTGYAAMLLSRKYHIPYIVHCHGLDVFLEESYQTRLNVSKIKKTCMKVYENANVIICVSEKVKWKLKELHLNYKIQVIYNGVDPKRFYPGEKIKKDELIILTIGNLIAIKGHEYTLRAFQMLVNNGIDSAKLVIIGKGSEELFLKKLAIELGIIDKVIFRGYIPYEEVAQELRNSDIFVLPSYYEALGCVYLEAMASGIPAVGCFGNGIDEIIQDRVNGMLVRPQNVHDLYNCLKELVVNKTLKEGIAQKGLETVRTMYTWDDSAKNLLNLYQK